MPTASSATGRDRSVLVVFSDRPPGLTMTERTVPVEQPESRKHRSIRYLNTLIEEHEHARAHVWLECRSRRAFHSPVVLRAQSGRSSPSPAGCRRRPPRDRSRPVELDAVGIAPARRLPGPRRPSARESETGHPRRRVCLLALSRLLQALPPRQHPRLRTGTGGVKGIGVWPKKPTGSHCLC